MGFFSRLRPSKAEPAAPVQAQDTKLVGHGVAGTNYHQKELQAMGKINPDYALDKRSLVKRWPDGVTVYEYTFSPKKAELVPEPENPHDPKAIKVLVDGVHVGYIKAGSCAHIHRLLRENRIQSITPQILGGKYKAVYCFDGYDRRAGRVEGYDLEKGEMTLVVRLDIVELLPPEKSKA